MSATSILRTGRRVTAAMAPLFLIASCASLSRNTSADDTSSEDAVSIGYGTQERSNITGAVASVTTDDVSGQDVTSLVDLINGRFAGVYAERLGNGGISIRIRGTSSIMGDNEPLVVIDGMPVGSNSSALMAVTPSDIERIDILKDAGSTAIYGSRGANGVVLISTKRAR